MSQAKKNASEASEGTANLAAVRPREEDDSVLDVGACLMCERFLGTAFYSLFRPLSQTRKNHQRRSDVS